MNGAVDAPGDERCVDDEKAGVEAPRASGRGDCPGEEVDGVERGMDAGRREACPGAGRRIFRRAIVGDSDGETRFLEGLADRRQRQAPREARRGPAYACVELLLNMRVERPRRGHAPVFRLDPAAGKDEFARHEPMAGVSLAHEHPRPRALAMIDENERGGVAGTENARMWGGLGQVLLLLRCDPNPCMPRAHCWPTIAPFA